MASTSVSNKRKRGASDANESLTITSSGLSKTQIGPALVSFPSLQPPRRTPFDVYIQQGDEGKEFVSQRTTIVAEADAVEFTGSSSGADDDSGSRYFVALHKPGSRKVILQPAPLYVLSRDVKALKCFRSTAPQPDQARILARNALGEAFGTKKSQAAIRAYERNKVDVGAMENVAGVLQDRIDLGTVHLPSKDEAREAADAARLIPAYNADAENPDDAYPLFNIIPEPEWHALDGLLPALRSAVDNTARLKAIPYMRSVWVKQRLANAYHQNKPKSQVVKMILYVAVLLAFRATTGGRSVPDRPKLLEKLSPAPDAVVDGLLTRFTEKARGGPTAIVTTAAETLLLTHMFAVCLKVDNFVTDPTVLASDLKMAPPKVNTLFKSLGCKVEELLSTERLRLGLPESAAGTKYAVLQVPLTFPKPKGKRRT